MSGKLVACMPVRNEEWILEKTLGDLSTYVDEIVIVDDGSTDRTPEIIRSFDKVTAIHTNPPGTLPFNNGQESTNRNKTLELARQREAEWILQIDADEILTSNAGTALRYMMSKYNSTIKLKICHLWNDVDHFRVDGDWGGFYRWRIFRFHGEYFRRMRYSPQYLIATPKAYDRKHRIIADGHYDPSTYTVVPDVKIVHYGWLSPAIRERSLRRYYEVFKLKYPQKKTSFKCFAKSERMLGDLKIVKQDDRKIELNTWAEVMGNEPQEKYRL